MFEILYSDNNIKNILKVCARAKVCIQNPFDIML